MEETKFDNLCLHYKDTYDIHRISIKQRDLLFYGLLVILALFTLQIGSTEIVTSMVSEYVNKTTGVNFVKNSDFISTLLWLVLLGFTTRYYQIVIEIERQYEYLHEIEKQLNNFYPNSKIFTREGISYLSKYPLFSNWVCFLYTSLFPTLIIFCIISRMVTQIETMNYIKINQLIDFICYLIVGTSSILYTYKLHEKSIEKIIAKIMVYLRS